MANPATNGQNAGDGAVLHGMTLEQFRAELKKDGLEQEDSIHYFWDGYLLVKSWLVEPDAERLWQLPKVQEFLRSFALIAENVYRETLKAENVYNFCLLCEDTYNQCYYALVHNVWPCS